MAHLMLLSFKIKQLLYTIGNGIVSTIDCIEWIYKNTCKPIGSLLKKSGKALGSYISFTWTCFKDIYTNGFELHERVVSLVIGDLGMGMLARYWNS